MSDVLQTAALQTLSPAQAHALAVVPDALEGGVLHVRVDRTRDLARVRQDLGLLTGYRIEATPEEAAVVAREVMRLYRSQAGEGLGERGRLDHGGDVVTQVLAEAARMDASDVHVEPGAEHARVRVRVDGALLERFSLPLETYPRYVNQIKVRAGLDISQKRLPQDGRMSFEDGDGHAVDVRVATLPTLYGERVTMRLLGRSAVDLRLGELGMAADQSTTYRAGIDRGLGIVIVSGPTGSGKTTTLYATLAHLNDEENCILTVEDPIEYTLPGINQVQVNLAQGLDFATALRSFMRHDPNIIMLGEIRDEETARIAVRLSLTGHLVLSTLHTNSAWGIVARLGDMGVPRYLLADTLNTLVAQRLLRRLCTSCRAPETYPAEVTRLLGVGEGFGPVGCPACNFTGYRGRVAIYELLRMDESLQRITREGGQPATELRVGLGPRAAAAVREGLTSWSEARGIVAGLA